MEGGQEGFSGQPAAALVTAITQAAAMLGAPFRTASELRRAAAEAVAEVVAKVEARASSR